MYILRRRHGWQLPLHPLQMVGMGVYILLVATFYLFVGPFVGNRIASIIVLAIHSSLAVSVMGLFIRCTATDPSDKTRQHRNRNQKRKKRKKSPSSKLNYGFLLRQIVVRMERNILNKCIRRKYLHLQQQQYPSNLHLQPLLLPFPASLVTKDDYPPLNDNDNNNNNNDNDKDELSFCSLCNFQVQKHSKHCRTCNRCVDGFDHHCRWLNNCVGRRNYTTFILLMISLLLMLLMEGGSSIAVFVRCFADKKGIEQELATQFHLSFHRGQGLLIAFSVFLFVITAYGSAALSQLLFFHILLIRKGMRTYDYILAMKEANQFNVSESFSDSDFSSDDNSEPESPTRPIVMSQFVCNGQTTIPSPGQFTVRIDPESGTTSMSNPNQGFRPSIDPWKLIQISKEKAFLATEKAKEKLAKEKQNVGSDSLKSLPLEMKSGPVVKPERDLNTTGLSLTPLISKGRFPGSPGRLSSPRRRFSGSPATLSVVSAGMPNQKYRNNFDLKITEVSRDLESYISRQVLCTVVKDGTEASPR